MADVIGTIGLVTVAVSGLCGVIVGYAAKLSIQEGTL